MELKPYKVTISYTVVEEAYIDARSEPHARELVSMGKVDCEWSTVYTDDWEIVEVEEAE